MRSPRSSRSARRSSARATRPRACARSRRNGRPSTPASERSMTRVAAGIVRRDRRILACRRSAAMRHPGKWEFPGGKVEAGETVEECLRRELDEELGIDAEIGALVLESVARYPGLD